MIENNYKLATYIGLPLLLLVAVLCGRSVIIHEYEDALFHAVMLLIGTFGIGGGLR